MVITRLEWSDIRKPDTACSYHHVTEKTPFGDFLITWKGWKESPDFSIDSTPWGDWFNYDGSLDGAKEMAEIEYQKRILNSLDEY